MFTVPARLASTSLHNVVAWQKRKHRIEIDFAPPPVRSGHSSVVADAHHPQEGLANAVAFMPCGARGGGMSRMLDNR
jgi:hypothetical protein